MESTFASRRALSGGWLAVTFATALLGLPAAGEVHAQQTLCANPVSYTWTLAESSTVALRWPNQAHSPNVFDADEVLLGRIIAETSGSIPNVCELAPSFPCASGGPPVFLLPAGSAEGPSNSGGSDECNRKTIACNSAVVPGAAHGGHPAGNQDGTGEYSYLVIHTPAVATSPAGKGIAFLSGSFVLAQCPYRCNDCPPLGRGRDESVTDALRNPTASAEVQLVSVSLWMTQASHPFGHSLLSLATGGAGPGASSACGSGVAYQSLAVDYCQDGLQPGSGNFVVPDQKTVFRTYSVDMSQMANFSNPGRCNPPGCYIENVIVPAVLTQNPNARNVQMLTATSKLPVNLTWPLYDSTVDSLIFAYTTQLLDIDNDGVEDRGDPCPNDPTDLCKSNLLGGGSCPAGQVFCADTLGDLGCRDAFLCNQRIDANQDCAADLNDLTRVAGEEDGVDGTEAFGSGSSLGPFDP